LKKNILVVEDDRDVLRAMSIRLKANGYDLSVASDAISAVSAARKAKPDLIVLDIGLPAGDGFVVMERLRSLYDLVLVPIIIVSGREPESTKKRALEAGAYAHFLKPFDNDEVLGAVKAALEISNSAGASKS
jgi:two-component system KDP operon response regulator KdpE